MIILIGGPALIFVILSFAQDIKKKRKKAPQADANDALQAVDEEAVDEEAVVEEAFDKAIGAEEAVAEKTIALREPSTIKVESEKY